MAIYANNETYLEQVDFRLYTKVTTLGNPDSLIDNAVLAQFLRQDDPSEIDFIRSLMYSAIDHAEQYMGRLLSPSVVTGEMKTYIDEFYLPYAPTEILTFQGEDMNGVMQDVKYRFSEVKSTLKIDTTSNSYAGYKNFVVTYRAGWDLDGVPRSVIYGLHRLVATMYESRQEETFGVSVSPSSVKTNRFFEMYRLRGV